MEDAIWSLTWGILLALVLLPVMGIVLALVIRHVINKRDLELAQFRLERDQREAERKPEQKPDHDLWSGLRHE